MADVIAAWNARAAATDGQFATAVHGGRVWQVVRECHNDSSYQDCDCLTCSNCGESYEIKRYDYDEDEFCTLDDAIAANEATAGDCDVSYCPNCGAKVASC